MRVLVVDDDETFRALMARCLNTSRHYVECVATGQAALDRLGITTFDVVLLDLKMPGLSGLDTLKAIRDLDWACEVVVLTGQPDYDDCVTAMKYGAFHYLCKPTEPELIEDTLLRAAAHVRLRVENAGLRQMLKADGLPEFVGNSPAARTLRQALEHVASTDSRVVLLGDTGAGKGLAARMIHNLSPRRTRPFLDIHCAAVPTQLLESELFGHERGAFTGAVSDKAGLFELANGGTLFLDEFADMGTEMQAKLLKVLDDGQFRRVGGTRAVTVDVRVLAATNRAIDEEVRAGRLRSDLLHRVDVVRITVPPLRDRREDIAILVDHFLDRHQRQGQARKTMTPAALEALQQYAWPGNVRELANIIERLTIICRHPVIEETDLPEHLKAPRSSAIPPEPTLTLDEVERRHIFQVLENVGGNQSEAARRLGIDRATLARKMRVLRAPMKSAKLSSR